MQKLRNEVFLKDRWGHLVTNNYLKVLDARRAPAALSLDPRAPTGTADANSAVNKGLEASFSKGAAYIPGVYAVGDCASVGSRGYAATAQVAEQQGTFLAQTLNEAAAAAARAAAAQPGQRWEDTLASIHTFKPADESGFKYRHKGSLAYIGSFLAVNDFTAGAFAEPLYGARIRGITAWLLWRSAYMTKLGAWRNRIQVPLDWARTFIFGRDVTQF